MLLDLQWLDHFIAHKTFHLNQMYTPCIADRDSGIQVLMMNIRQQLGARLAAYLAAPGKRDVRLATCPPEKLASTIRKGDVLLVEGSSRFSTAIKYLTQSTWSHAAFCIADLSDSPTGGVQLLEAEISAGVRYLSLENYQHLHTRICRPVGLSSAEIDTVVAHLTARVGHQYDLRNVFDLARYLIQTPPVPRHWRRRMLALGSGDPTRAICSTLIAGAFESIRYPILPDIIRQAQPRDKCEDCYNEILHVRHHSLFAPRDFDISPYFQIIKPTLDRHFDPHQLEWAAEP